MPCLPSRPGEILGLSTEHAGMEYVPPEIRTEAGSYMPRGRSLPSFWSKQVPFMTQEGVLSKGQPFGDIC